MANLFPDLVPQANPVSAEQPVVNAGNLFPDLAIVESDQQPKVSVQQGTEDNQSFAAGAGQSLLKGATLGFSEEIQSVIAATVAAPFISDKTFSQLMVDARQSFREDQERFAQENPKTALGLELAGGLVTGGAGLAKNVAGQTFKQAIKQGVKTGAVIGGVTGAGMADVDEFLSQETVQETAKGIVTGASLGGLTPIAIKGIVKAGKIIPKELPESLLQTALKIRPSIPPDQRLKITQTALKEGILPTVKGLEKITSKLSKLDKGLNTLIDDATKEGAFISKKVLFNNLSDLRKKVGGAKIDAGSELKQVNAVAKAFDEHLKKIDKRRLTPREVQDLKTAAYKSINFDISQGKASFAKNETRKAIAKSAKESLEKIDPAIKPTNQRIGNLIELNNEMERAVSRLDNRNLISLDTAAKVAAGGATGSGAGTAIGTGAAFFGAPRVKARTALALESIRKAGEVSDTINKTLPGELAVPLNNLINDINDMLKLDIDNLSDEE